MEDGAETIVDLVQLDAGPSQHCSAVLTLKAEIAEIVVKLTRKLLKNADIHNELCYGSSSCSEKVKIYSIYK